MFSLGSRYIDVELRLREIPVGEEESTRSRMMTRLPRNQLAIRKDSLT